MGRIANNKSVAKKKGFMALGGVIGTGVLFVYTPVILGVAGVAGTAYLTWDWFKWRAKHGLRF